MSRGPGILTRGAPGRLKTCPAGDPRVPLDVPRATGRVLLAASELDPGPVTQVGAIGLIFGGIW